MRKGIIVQIIVTFQASGWISKIVIKGQRLPFNHSFELENGFSLTRERRLLDKRCKRFVLMREKIREFLPSKTFLPKITHQRDYRSLSDRGFEIIGQPRLHLCLECFKLLLICGYHFLFLYRESFPLLLLCIQRGNFPSKLFKSTVSKLLNELLISLISFREYFYIF